ncbi:MAG: carboxypeptidase-like regulatory domain-containing protein [Saprospiraceae bacterium]
MKRLLIFTLFIFSLSVGLIAQTATIRGNVYDSETGAAIEFGNVLLEGTTLGTTTDGSGFFTISNVPAGTYKIVATYIGYVPSDVEVVVREGSIIYKKIQLAEGVNLDVVEVSGRKEQARKEVQVSKVRVTPQQIKALPTIGGEADIAQYLTVIPGVILTGDQGGQIYIRGGSPIQNKILLDGMRIYNPFHSIGFFSVFETEAIKSVDVLTGGFNAEYGGAISAIVDIQTREGNKKRTSGVASVNPFVAKLLLEGPIAKLKDDGGGSISYILTAKQSLLEQTSESLYTYADSNGLPYGFQDIYGKLSFVSENGSKINAFGFNFNDGVNFENVAEVNWRNFGLGTNFTLIPPASNFIVGGTVAFSKYSIELQEEENFPRESDIVNYSVDFNFTNFVKDNELKYGFEFTGFDTNFEFRNLFGQTFQQRDFTSELAVYMKYKIKAKNLVIEPSVRAHYYASQSTIRFEPRFGLKYNITDRLRFKAAGGLYSQNLVSTVNEQDVVNLFVGFLSGPSEQIFEPDGITRTSDRLQKSIHGVAGFEFDVTKNIEVNVEPYYKRFSQLLAINDNKLSDAEPDFVTETGDAYGIDFLVKYQNKNLYVWTTYSYGFVNRFDGEQTYPTVFDRRHNMNFLATYTFGAKKNIEAGVRWNLGSGFPFTQTQGFLGKFDFFDGLESDPLTEQPRLETVFADDRNGGRLPYYHRMDLSLKHTAKFSKYMELETVLSVTNVYNRENIFFFDRVEYERRNQLPILPSLGFIFRF